MIEQERKTEIEILSYNIQNEINNLKQQQDLLNQEIEQKELQLIDKEEIN